MHALDDSDTGTWLVRTETSLYELDLDQGRVMRHPGAAADPHVAADGARVLVGVLPGDDHWVPLILLYRCEVGAPLILVTRSEDGSWYWRVSTLVQSIDPLAADPAPDGSSPAGTSESPGHAGRATAPDPDERRE